MTGYAPCPAIVDGDTKRIGSTASAPAEYSSQRSHTAVHEQQGAGDVRGIVGGQKQDRGGDLLGPARALQHGGLCGPGVVLLDGLAGGGDAALMERREDRAGDDGVHPNALRRVVGGERPVKPATATLVVSYCRLPPPATTERTEATLTMAPPLLRRISGTAALAQKT